MPKKIIVALILFFLISNKAVCQENTSVLFLKKGNTAAVKPDTASFNAGGFYLYKNAVYNFKLKSESYFDGRQIKLKNGRFLYAKNETLFFTNFLTAAAAEKAYQKLDTIPVHYTRFRKLVLSKKNKYRFKDYAFVFKNDTAKKELRSKYVQLFSNDTTRYELVPYITDAGIAYVYELFGKTQRYNGITGIEKPVHPDSIAKYNYTRRNFFWFTPGKVDEINGLALGLWPENTKPVIPPVERSLKVNGLNIEVNPVMVFIIPIGLASLSRKDTLHKLPDSTRYFSGNGKGKYEAKITGVNLSFFGTLADAQLNGLNIGGLTTQVENINGVSVSGLTNSAGVVNGICIALLHNKAAAVKGIQIGLVNKAASLRGFQLGLWNRNEKRSLPFINWQFRPKAVK
jgi:hypothetical protein